MANSIIGADFDGTLPELTAQGFDISKIQLIITGRPPERKDDTEAFLRRFNLNLPVYYFTGAEGNSHDEMVGNFKLAKIKELGVTEFYEDMPEQVKILKAGGVKVTQVVPRKKDFIIVTSDFSGIGFAQRLKEEGFRVVMAYKIPPEKIKDVQKEYSKVGEGIIDKIPLDSLMKNRANFKDWYFVWDGNHNVSENELLRKEGFKVFLGGKFADLMEHDRNASLKLAKKYGLQSPPSFPFSDSSQALKFVQQNEETAYVFKPDEGENFDTWVPESEDPKEANKELQIHLQHLQAKGNFILQERKDGVETNVEVWFEKGDPVFAFMCIESKKKSDKDLGDMIGCAFDFAFTIPLDSDAVTLTVGKLYPFYKKNNYTGFGDANIIFANDGVWYFEKCERFGYNSHPNLLFNLNKSKLGDTLADMTDGVFSPDFSKGFGSSVTFYDEHPKMGKAIQFPESLEDKLYIWDAYKEKDQYLTAGYDNNILICLGYGYTIPTAWENVMVNADKVKFKGRTYRTDANRTDYPSSPIRRYESLVSMGLLEDRSPLRMHRELSDRTEKGLADSKKAYDESLAKERDLHKHQMDRVKGMIKDALT